MKILAIDPGTTESAYLEYDTETGRPGLQFGIVENAVLLALLRRSPELAVDHLAIEMVASYGMPVGADVFETVWWIGRFSEAWTNSTGRESEKIYRKDVKLHLCHSSRAKDPHVRQAIIDRFGGKEIAIGRKGSYGPLKQITTHLISALAVALFVGDRERVMR
jgi:hypothetical protein